MRTRFEELCVEKFGAWREAGNRANDNGAPLDREALCWKDEKGNYGVLALNAAWWGYRMAMQETVGPHGTASTGAACSPISGGSSSTPTPSREALKDALRATGFLTQSQAWDAADAVLALLTGADSEGGCL